MISNFKGLVGPSANRYNHISPTSKKDVEEELGERVDYILDGGKCKVGIESIIVKIDTKIKDITIIRKGMLSKKNIEKKIGYKTRYQNKKIMQITKDNTPGNSYNHYCPNALLIIIRKPNKLIRFLLKRNINIGIIFFKKNYTIDKNEINEKQNTVFINLDKSEKIYAENIYRNLRFFDKKKVDIIFIEAIPEREEWSGIRDRLKKACIKKQQLKGYKNLIEKFCTFQRSTMHRA